MKYIPLTEEQEETMLAMLKAMEKYFVETEDYEGCGKIRDMINIINETPKV